MRGSDVAVTAGIEGAIMRLRAIAEGPRLKEAVMAGAQRVADDLRDYYGAKDADEPNSFFAKGEGTRRR